MARAHSTIAWIGGLPRRCLMLGIRAYQLFVSPCMGPSCRFEPTCSAYAIQALQVYGAFKGTQLTLHRLMRCNPWCQGGHDPVPIGRTACLDNSSTGTAQPVLHPSSSEKISS